MKGKGDIIYLAKDFERYHSGKMTGKEMYALEKAALADPFLQEALEGYAHTHNAEEDIKLLQEKLTKRLPEKQKTTIILWNKNSFLKVAILISFLAGSAYLLLTQNNKTVENSTLASSAPSELKEVKKDSGSKENNTALQENIPATITPAPVFKLNKNKAESEIAKAVNPIEDKSLQTATLNVETLEDAARSAATPTAPIENAAGNFLVKGKVVNQQGEPIPFATIITKKEQINADITGNYSAFLKDSSLYGNVVASGYMPLQKQFNNSLSETIVLKTDLAMADKAIEQIKTQSAKKAEVNVRGISSVTAEEIKNKNLLIPVNGWQAYQQYLQDSVRYQNNKREMVQLSFTVTPTGRPQEIKVIDGLCLPCNKEAIRLLKEGPDWKPLPQGEGILKVQF